jgi:hypothetical protein
LATNFNLDGVAGDGTGRVSETTIEGLQLKISVRRAV